MAAFLGLVSSESPSVAENHSNQYAAPKERLWSFSRTPEPGCRLTILLRLPGLMKAKRGFFDARPLEPA
jgi:hypothetical protein